MLQAHIYATPLYSSIQLIIRSLTMYATNSSHESKSTSTNCSSFPSKVACMKHGDVAFSNPNLLFMYSSAFCALHQGQEETQAIRGALRTLPFMVDILCLPMAMIRLVNSTMIGFVLGAFAVEINACTTSPIPAAYVFVECTRPARVSVCDVTGEPLKDILGYVVFAKAHSGDRTFD